MAFFACIKSSHIGHSSAGLAQQFFEDLVPLLRVGAATAGLHHLTDQAVKGFLLAAAILFDHRLVVGDDLFDHGLDRARIGLLFEAFCYY